MHIEAFVQARMGSTRLPGKVLEKVLGRPLLDFLLERLAQSKEIDGIAVLTTTQAADNVIAAFCRERNIPCFRGSEEDVLSRYYEAALERRPDAIVRITADCPLIDPDIVDEVVKTFRENFTVVDYVSNSLERTFPLGLDVEVFSFDALERAYREAKLPEEREHVTVYLYRHPKLFRLKNVAHVPSLAQHRWTVDTPEDFTLVELMLENLYKKNPRFRLKDMLHLIEEHPKWSHINAHIQQKQLP